MLTLVRTLVERFVEVATSQNASQLSPSRVTELVARLQSSEQIVSALEKFAEHGELQQAWDSITHAVQAETLWQAEATHWSAMEANSTACVAALWGLAGEDPEGGAAALAAATALEALTNGSSIFNGDAGDGYRKLLSAFAEAARGVQHTVLATITPFDRERVSAHPLLAPLSSVADELESMELTEERVTELLFSGFSLFSGLGAALQGLFYMLVCMAGVAFCCLLCCCYCCMRTSAKPKQR